MKVSRINIMPMEEMVEVLLEEYEKEFIDESFSLENQLEEYKWYDIDIK